MVEMTCDKCKRLTGTEAFYIRITPISNKTAYHKFSVEAKIESSQTSYGLILCPECRAKLLPTESELNTIDEERWSRNE